MASSEMGAAVTDPRLLLLAPDDNILVACTALAAGTEISIDGADVRLEAAVAIGHKVARHDLAAGEKVIKYGVPIGSLSAAVRRGGHVHTHNLNSDYIPTFTDANAERYLDGGATP